MTMPCLSCVQQSQRYVGVPGLYGLAGVGLGDTAAPSQKSSYDVKRDVTAATIAFGLPALYHYKAPKKWKRPGKLGAVAAVVGVYFLTSFIYGKVVEA